MTRDSKCSVRLLDGWECVGLRHESGVSIRKHAGKWHWHLEEGQVVREEVSFPGAVAKACAAKGIPSPLVRGELVASIKKEVNR